MYTHEVKLSEHTVQMYFNEVWQIFDECQLKLDSQKPTSG